MSIDGADYQVWQQDVTTTQGVYTGIAGRTYEFLALATDKAGNVEQQVLLRDLSRNNNTGGGGVATGGGNNTPPTITTNPIFTEAQQQLLASVNTTKPSEFLQVIRPFTSSTFVKNIATSEAGIGALAILSLADGTLLASGGANRGDLYAIDKLDNKRLINTLSEPIFDLAQDANGTIWATTGGGALIQIDPQTGQIVKRFGDGITQTLAINPTTLFVSDLGLLVHNTRCGKQVPSEIGTQLELFPEPPKQLELNLNLGDSPEEYITNYNYVGGENPNKLITRRVRGNSSNGQGVYIKFHNDLVKVGMAGDETFAGRYSKTNPDGGATIEIEISQTRHGPVGGLSKEDTEYWQPDYQRRFDEEYVDKLVPKELRYRAERETRPVSQKKWDLYRHIFGYGNIPSNFGY